MPRHSFSRLRGPALGLGPRSRVLEPHGNMSADWVTRGLTQSALVDVVDVVTAAIRCSMAFGAIRSSSE